MLGRFEKFSFAIAQINKYWHRIANEEMKRYGLKGTYAMYLIAMCQYPDGITAASLGEVCGKDKADVSRTVSDMIGKGLIVRDVSKSKNMYRALLFLTDKGKEAAKVIENRAGVAVEAAGGTLTEEQREIFYGTLDKIVVSLKNISEKGLPY